jgi:hypothetical protein
MFGILRKSPVLDVRQKWNQQVLVSVFFGID